MTRAEVAEYIGDRYTKYLDAVGRTDADTAGNLKPAIDDALLAMGYGRAELATAAPDEDDDEAFIAQVEFQVLRAVVRDLGATNFDIGSEGDSLKLEQIWKHAKVDLEDAKSNVLAIFGSIAPPSPNGGLFTLGLNYLEDDCDRMVS